MPKELITVRVSPAVKDLLAQLAYADDRTISYMAEHLIIEGLKARGIFLGNDQPPKTTKGS